MARLAAVVYVSSPEGEPVVLGPDSDLPDWAAGVITNPKAWADPPEPAAVPTDEPAEPYKGVTVPELKAEIAKRNEGRPEDQQISSDGKRDELVAALVLDDNK